MEICVKKSGLKGLLKQHLLCEKVKVSRTISRKGGGDIYPCILSEMEAWVSQDRNKLEQEGLAEAIIQ